MLLDAVPTLRVVTRALPRPLDTEALLEHAAADSPRVWLRRGAGLAAQGEVLRISNGGDGRFTATAADWRRVAAAATVDDAVRVPGTGLVAFGSFAFADGSGAASDLVVPRMIVGSDGERGWVTTITRADSAETASDRPAPLGRAALATLFAPAQLSSEAYSSAVDAALRRIDADDVEKVVLARELTARLQPDADLRAPLLALADSYPDCWTFAVDGLLGSSPEMLVRVESGTVQARVLAGSRARGDGVAADRKAALELATSEKDHDEHGFAVRSVLSSLGSHTSSLAASEIPFTLKLANLWHLASDVEGCLADGSSSLDLLAAMHPTAAVAGTPTPAALRIIAELEPFDRRRYAAPVGWVDADGDGEWAIALRCAEVLGDAVTAYAGAGIVAGSVAQRELAETGMKFRPVLDAFS
ncbi:MAG: chorismate-binding protein [Naasia sp.]